MKSQLTSKWRYFVLMALIICIVAAHLITLDKYPLPSCDEVAYADAAYSLVTLGRPAWSVFPESDRFGRDVTVVHMGRIYLAGLGATLLAFGRTLWATRFYSLLGGLLAVGLTFLVGQKLYNPRVGLLAGAVFFTSFKFFLTSHFGRPEIWATVSILVTFYLLLQVLEANPSKRLLFWTGLAAVWMLDFHFNALAFLAAVTVLAAWHLGWKQRQWKSMLVFGAGLSLGLAGWVAAHAWPAPLLAWQQLTSLSVGYTSLGSANPLATLAQNPATLLGFWRTVYWDTPWPISLIETGLAVMGLALAFYRRALADKIWLTMLGVSWVTFAFLFSQRFVEYSVLWMPFWLLGGFAALELLTKRWSKGNRELASLVLLSIAGLMCILQIGANGWLVYKYRENNFKQMEAELLDLVPEGARVMGDDNWWWALKTNRVFISDQYFLTETPPPGGGGTDPLAVVQPWVTSLMQRLHPDFVLLDNAIGCSTDHGPGWTELVTYLEHFCEPVAQMPGVWINDPEQKTVLLGQTTTVYQCRESHS